ncbi:O-antigen polysaccharide polymerase Wzy [Ruminococcus sp.]|uniref:O-antigen polysaccharide polymerase Wzy n=1 Tax=Ruminococcus sp. TaxID=41978 RepID=UPI003FD7E3F3
MLVDKRSLRARTFNIVKLSGVIAVYSCLLLILKNIIAPEAVLRIACIGALIIFAFEIRLIYQVKKRLFVPEILFLLSYYVLQNGQLLLMSLDIDFNNNYIMSLYQYLADASVFASISTVLAGLAACITTRYTGTRKKVPKIDKMDSNYIATAGMLGLAVSAVIAIPLVLIKTLIVLRGGYYAVRNFEGKVPSIIGFIEYMFMPFAVLCMVYCSKKSRRIIIGIIVIWAALTALCGDRTSGIAALVVVLYFGYNNATKNVEPKKKIKIIVTLLVILVFLGVFIQVAFAVRTHGEVEQKSLFSLLVQTFSDLGFSCFPLFTMMNVVPGYEAYLYGKSYVYSFIGGFMPTFLDPTGIVSSLNAQSRVYEVWQDKYYGQYSFGFGFSLNSEAYINFGWFGLIMIFLLLLFITRQFNNYDENNVISKWSSYKSIVLLFLWFTLPRRDSYYIWNSIAYAVILMQIYLRGIKFVVRLFRTNTIQPIQIQNEES